MLLGGYQGGMIMIHDAHLNAEKNGPLPVAEYSVLLMFSTEGRCYSISEMEDMLDETEFSEIFQSIQPIFHIFSIHAPAVWVKLILKCFHKSVKNLTN